ncbi:hypothetical protein [Streptomyces clavuligerus]|uniref:hypothetical protein n=1 Tax=Streptomyces clavuligerus TaxID=1901 RepID=UPI001E58FE3B|nr:hypothetical protein [Streptomyces clavuligerus]
MAHAGRKQRAAGLALALFCALTAVTGPADALTAGALLLLAAVPLTLGELWQSAGGWGISYGLAPEEQRTYYLSVYQLGATGMTVAGRRCSPSPSSTRVPPAGSPSVPCSPSPAWWCRCWRGRSGPWNGSGGSGPGD